MHALARQKWNLFAVAAALSLGLFFAPSAFAIPTMYPKLRDHEVRVGLQGNGYLTPAGDSNSDSGTGNLGLNVGVRGVGQKNQFHFGVEAESLYGLRHSNYRYLDIGELYAGFEKKEAPKRASVYLGRKRYEWNALDSYWSLGLYQPRFRWDYLNERENGLFGLFTGFNSEMIQATAYASPIFIPEQGAPFDISGGNCRSSSPWFSCPGSSIRIFNQPTPVRFTLDVPPVKKLILHAGAGGTIRVGKEQGLFGRLSYAHKPINQFLLSFEGRLNLAANEVPAVIRPRVLYHDLYGLDFGWNRQKHSVTASVMAERPQRDYTPPTWNTQEISNATVYGITAKTQPFTGFKYTRLEASFLHRDGGISPDRGPFVSPGVDYFEPRFAFKNAFSFAIFTPVIDAWARDFLFSTKFILDTANEGNILITDFYYSPFTAFFFNLGCDILGSNSKSPVDFISRYQRNDRVRGGVAYVF
jgi:hypothetical protein